MAQSPNNVDYPRSTDDLQRSLQKAYERINSLQQSVAAMPPSLTTDQVKAMIGPTAAAALSVGGSNPIFLTQIAGSSTVSQIYAATHAIRLVNYPPSTTPNNSIFFETDRTVTYMLLSGTWIYQAGTMIGLLGNIPNDLGSSDTGFLYFATDYQHLYRWAGAAWTYAPGDVGSGYIEMFTVAPRTGYWHLCDGSGGIHESLPNGTIQLVNFAGLSPGVLPALNAGIYLRANSVVDGVIAAAVAPTLTMDPFTPGGTVTASFAGGTITFTTGNFGAGMGGAALVGPTSISLSGPVTASFTGSTATPTGTISKTGLPDTIDLLPYYRL